MPAVEILTARAFAPKMPIALGQLLLHCDSPIGMRARAGANLMTSLRGLLLRHIVRNTCLSAGHCSGSAPLVCRQPASCAAQWLLSPHSEYQRRDHAQPVVLHADLCDARTIALRVVIFGKRAISQQTAIWSAIAQAGTAGLIDGSARLRWTVQAGPVRLISAAEWADGPVPARLWANVFGLTGSHGGSFARQLANMAHDMTQFALTDAGLDADLGKPGSDQRSDEARQFVLDAMSQISQQWHEAQIDQLGARFSRSNRGYFDLSGVSGLIELDGNLDAVAPWLSLSTLWGLGGRKSFGMGRVHYLNDDGCSWPREDESRSAPPPEQIRRVS